MLFVNTRPDDRAQALTECLEQANFTVLALPVLNCVHDHWINRLKIFI